MQVGDTAPDFTAPLATGDDVESFTLSEALEDGPVVLAFFPAAFTSTCSHEMATFRDRLDEFTASDARVYGISTDLPPALNAFHDELDLNFPLISDANRDLVTQYDVATSFAGIDVAARRAVFVVGADGVVDYVWVGENPGLEPDYDEVAAAATDA